MVKSHILRWGLGACAVALPLVFSLADTGHGSNAGGQSKDTPPGETPAASVLLSCGTGTQPALPDPQHAICKSLHQALETSFPSHVFQCLPYFDSTEPGRDYELWITLHITRADSHIIDAHLEWTKAGSATITGPTVTLSVLDRPLTPRLYPSLAKSLIKNSALPL